MPREEQEFEVDGLTFAFKAMPLPAACKGAEQVAELWAGSVGDVAGALAKSIGKLPGLVDMFAGYCSFDRSDGPHVKRVSVAKFKDELFDSHLDRAVLFVANCVTIEYADFLTEGVERIGAGLGTIANSNPHLAALMARMAQSASSGA